MKMYNIVGFQKLYNKIKNNNMPLKTAYKFSKLIQKVNNEIVFYQDELNKILNKYGERDEEGNFILTDDGTGIKIKTNFLKNCQNEVNELENLEIDLSGIKFTIEELSTLEITIEEMEFLMPLIGE